MSKGTGLYWLGKGTLGNVSQNEEIPAGLITEKRMNFFMDQGLIGEKMKPVAAGDNAKLKVENAKLKKEIDELKKNKKANKEDVGIDDVGNKAKVKK